MGRRVGASWSTGVVELTVFRDTAPRIWSRPLVAGIGAALTALATGVPLASCSDAPAAGPVQMQTAAVDQPKSVPIEIAAKVGSSTVGNYLAGRFAQKRRDFATAARLLSNALKADPNNRDLLRRAFLANLASGQMSAAHTLAARITAAENTSPLANLMLVVGEIRDGAFEAAERRLGTVGTRGFNAFMVPLLSAWAQAGRGRFDEAQVTLGGLKGISGFTVIHDLHAALIYDLAGRTDQAEQRYLAAIKVAPRPTVRLVEAVGSFYERTGRPEEAEKRYRAYLGRQNESLLLENALSRLGMGKQAAPIVTNAKEGAAEVFFNVSGTLLQENSIEVALIYGRLALELRPRFPLARVLVGRMLESVGRAEDAIAVYDGVDKTSPLWWSARLRRAGGLEVLGREEEAISQLRQMAGERKTRSDALANLGDILRAAKRFKESVAAYDGAIKRIGPMERRHWTLLYSRGIALERTNRWARAEADFIAALELNPDQPYVLNYLGYSWVDKGINLERARRMIERAVELRPNDGYIVDSLGWVLYRIREFGGAATHLERAVELRPQDPTINDHLGDAYWKVGRHNEARFQWRRALSLDPEPDQVGAIRKKIEAGLVDIEAKAKAAGKAR